MPARKTTVASSPPASEPPAPPAGPETEQTTEDPLPAADADSQEQTPAAAGLAPDPAYVAALQRERSGYVRHGLAERAAAVDAELKAIGAPPADDA